VQLQRGDLFAMPYQPGSMDLVWSSHVFHGLSRLPAAALAVRRVLRSGGRFALRENRVTATLLPSDIGLGEPGLESRLNFAFDAWLRRDRAGRGAYPHGWTHLLRAAGFMNVQARSFLHEVQPPFTAQQSEYLRYYLGRKLEIENVSDADKAILRQLLDADGPHYFLRRDDLHFVAVSTVYLGTAP